MSLILNIDTTLENALVNIAANGMVLEEMVSSNQKDHASFLHPAIISLLQKAGYHLQDIDAVAVGHGPGSYTGIRVGVAAAKGLCYATGKPLIAINELEVLAKDASAAHHKEAALYCPMIDARRMEVFTAMYDETLKCIEAPSAMILEKDSFAKYLQQHTIIFCGSGITKWQTICSHVNARYTGTFNKGFTFAELSYKKFLQGEFSDTAYSTPLYIKDFHSTMPAR